jgi:hypothetical protein
MHPPTLPAFRRSATLALAVLLCAASIGRAQNTNTTVTLAVGAARA